MCAIFGGSTSSFQCLAQSVYHLEWLIEGKKHIVSESLGQNGDFCINSEASLRNADSLWKKGAPMLNAYSGFETTINELVFQNQLVFSVKPLSTFGK